ncbi:hypothetical protein [Ornithinimicrobium tianjinense]|uniref:EspG family protein n=1 Tax=Ornithinimicrobium tianjinense TaxID=1195761 RepID=A0A917F4N7_9MICO|nr:hypothetical protein [Ornithinimicrobium tianjinense]GGF50005.1 hypothetical protein GCM10011366_17360 [Ornithinimicrobium tianjinense]
MILVLAVTAAELTELEDARRADHGQPPQAERAAVALEARSSLRARGLLDAAGRLQVDDSDESLLLTTVLDVRLTATRTLVVERVVAPEPGQDAAGQGFVRGVRLVHLLDREEGAVVEDLLEGDVRHLWIAPDREQLLDAVTSVTVPSSALAGQGPPRRVPATDPTLLAASLDHPTCLAELTVVEGGEPVAGELLALGPRGCWSTGIDRSEAPPAVLEYRPVPPGHVAAWVARAARQGTMTR